MIRLPLILFALALVPFLSGTAAADLEIKLTGRKPAAVPPDKTAAQRAVARRSSNRSAAPSPIRGALASRSMLRQVGVVRRGAAPLLPPAGDAEALLPATTPQPPPLVPVNARLGRVLPPTTDAHRLPDPRSPWVARLSQNQQVAVLSQWQGWYAVLMGDGSQAYVPQPFVELQPYAVRSVAPVPPAPVEPQSSTGGLQLSAATTLPAAPNDLARAVIDEAFRYEGVPYVYGGNTERGIDCSGLVRNCFSAQGLRLPRRASEQARLGRPVSLDQLQPGDRLYFSVKKQHDHTGIYLGEGYFIHAAMSRGKVGIDHLSTPLYGKTLTDARRF